MADTKKCLQAFEEAGADLFYAPSLHDLATIRTRCHSVTKTVNVVMGMPGSTFDLAQLAEVGARISVGSALASVALGAFLAVRAK